MKYLTIIFVFMLCTSGFSEDSAVYKVLPGMLHSKGKVIISILPDTAKYKVQMEYDVKTKALVPIPNKLLKGKTVYEFPQDFRTEAGYKKLEKEQSLTIPKAILKFVKRADHKDLKSAYFIEVHPINKKTKIDIIYHPSLPSVGWSEIKITFISKIPVLDGYVLEAEIKK